MSTANDTRFWDRTSRRYASTPVVDEAGLRAAPGENGVAPGTPRQGFGAKVWDGAGMNANDLAIIPNATHHNIFADTRPVKATIEHI